MALYTRDREVGSAFKPFPPLQSDRPPQCKFAADKSEIIPLDAAVAVFVAKNSLFVWPSAAAVSPGTELKCFAQRPKEFVQRLAASRKRANATGNRQVATPLREAARFFREIAKSVRPADTSKRSPKSAEWRRKAVK